MSEELEKIEPTNCTLKIAGKERQIKFGFSAWAKIEKTYGSVSNFAQIEKDMQEKPFETIPKLIYIGLVDKEGVTEETVLDDYGFEDIELISKVLTQAMVGSLPVDKSKKKVTTMKK